MVKRKRVNCTICKSFAHKTQEHEDIIKLAKSIKGKGLREAFLRAECD